MPKVTWKSGPSGPRKTPFYNCHPERSASERSGRCAQSKDPGALTRSMIAPINSAQNSAESEKPWGLAQLRFLRAPPRKRLPHPSRFRRVGGTNQDSIGFLIAPHRSTSKVYRQRAIPHRRLGIANFPCGAPFFSSVARSGRHLACAETPRLLEIGVCPVCPRITQTYSRLSRSK